MMNYNVYLNNGIEAFGVNEKTITANEVVETVGEKDLAREIVHENPLIPEQVATAVLQNFCKAAANLMSMGFAIQLKNGDDVALRIYPDIHVKGGNIDLERAKQIDPTITELTLENAGDLVSRVGVTVRAKAECQKRFTDLLLSKGAGLKRKDIVERAKIMLKDGTDDNQEPVETANVTINAVPNDATMGTVTGGGTYVQGASVTLTATANAGYHFVQWSNGRTTASITVTAEADATLTATFAADNPGGNGGDNGMDG